MQTKQTDSPEIVLERVFAAPPELVWRALTERDMMQHWYFNLTEFRAEVGFHFEFMGGPPDGTQYRHICEITEVVSGRKLTYSWRYAGYGGLSHVTFELAAENSGTRLTLRHTGLDSLAAEHPDFAVHNFRAGWEHIVNISLRDYLAQETERAQ